MLMPATITTLSKKKNMLRKFILLQNTHQMFQQEIKYKGIGCFSNLSNNNARILTCLMMRTNYF